MALFNLFLIVFFSKKTEAHTFNQTIVKYSKFGIK